MREREREKWLQMLMTFVEGGGFSGCRRKGLLYDTHNPGLDIRLKMAIF
jgi:hypothetical protein